jgi:hypothetical protein
VVALYGLVSYLIVQRSFDADCNCSALLIERNKDIQFSFSNQILANSGCPGRQPIKTSQSLSSLDNNVCVSSRAIQ